MWLRKSLRTKTTVRRLPGKSTGSSAGRLARSRRLQLEPLEQRAMLTDYTVSATQDGSADTFRLVKNGTNVQAYVNGALNQTIPLSGLGKITISGSNDADTLTIDASGGTFAVPSGVTFNAGSGTDTLVTNSQTSNGDTMCLTPTGSGAGNVAYVAADGTETNLPTTTYTGLENVTLTGQAGEGDMFAIDGTTGNDTFTVNEGGSAGAGTVAATLNGGAYSLPAVTFTNMSATVENLINGATLTNGGGVDTLTFNGTTSADTITATPGFLNGMFLAANTGGDRIKLRADNMASIGVNCGDGNDTINLSGGAKAALAIDAGAGTDAIHISNSPDPDVYIDSTNHIICRFGTDQVSYANAETVDGASSTTLPTPPVAGALFWVDASTLTLPTGSAVTTLNDLSGNNNNLTAIGTGATFNVNPCNGRATLHFSGGTNCMQTTNNLGISGDVGRSWFVVMRYNTGNRLTMSSGVDAAGQSFSFETAPWINRLPAQGSDSISISGPIQTANTYQVYEASHDSGSHTTYGYMNGALQGQVGCTLNTANTQLVIGQCGYGYLDGDLAEVLIYNRYLSDSERQTVESYLNSKWNLNGGPVIQDDLPVANAAAHFDASKTTTVLRADYMAANANEPVAMWRSATGTGSAIQTTDAGRPIYGSHQINGKNVLYFDGTNDILTSNRRL